MNRTVKIHSMESETVTPICFRFQVNKCPFDDKCKYRHIKDDNFIPHVVAIATGDRNWISLEMQIVIAK